MGLKDFPHFGNEAALVKALREQGFEVGEPNSNNARRVAHPLSGNAVYIHPSTTTDRSGQRSKKDLHALAAIGFLPPAEFAAQTKKEVKERKPPPRPAPDPEPPVVSDERAFPCEACAVARCPRCAEQELPCAFRYPWNRGRHHSAQHPDAPRPASVAKPRTTSRRSGPVRTRTDPSVIKDPFTRLGKELKHRLEMVSEVVDAIVELAESRELELHELRRFRKEVEDQAGRLYDVTTRPTKKGR